MGSHELSVEIADILKPVQIGSICVECEGIASDRADVSLLDAIRTMRDQLGLPGSMVVKSYIDVLQDWAGQ